MSWQALTGVFEWRVDEGLRDVGRRRFHEAGGLPDLARRGAVQRSALRLAVRWAFVARRHPWRLAVVSLRDQDAGSPAVTAWADEATAVLKGAPAAQHVVGPNQSWGNLGLRRMLQPESLTTFVPPPWPASFRIRGDLLDGGPSVAPEFTSLAVDHYEARFDPALGVVTAWTAFIDGAVALHQTLAQLTAVDESSDSGS